MRAHIKRLSKDSMFYGFGMAFSRLFSFVVAPILTNIFTPAEYGIMSLLRTTFGLMIVIALINVSSGVYRYYFDTENIQDRKVIISTSIIFHVVVALFFSVLVWVNASVFSDMLNIRQNVIEDIDYSKFIKILSFGLFFSIMDTQFKSLLRMLRKPKRFAILTSIQIIVNFLAVILLVVVFDFRIEGSFYAGIIASIITVIIGFFMVVNEYTKAFSFVYLRLFFSYALPQFPAVFFNWGLSQSNRFFLNFYSNLTEQGIYSIGYKIASVFLLFSMAFRMAWDPFALSIMKKSDAKEIYRKFYNYFIILFVWLASGLALFGKFVLMIMIPEKYHSSYLLIGILSFAFFLQTANNMLGIGISISKKTKYISYIQLVVFIVVLISSFLLIPHYESFGAALVFLIGAQVQSLLYYLIAERLYKVNYDFLKMFLFSLSVFSVTYFGMIVIDDLQTVLSSAVVALIFTLITLTLSIGILVHIDKNALLSIKRLFVRKKINHY